MKAVVYKKEGIFTLEEREKPKLQEATDAIVKITLASICSSDIHIKKGAVPKAVPGIIVGHEMVGIVESIGEKVTSVQPGERVAVNVETFCGECFFCKRGFVNNCTDEQGGWALGCRIDGGQTEYVRVPFADQGLTKIPDTVTDRQALFTGDLLSTGYWAAQMTPVTSQDTIAVIGAGPTGLCVMMCLRLYHPARIIAIDKDKTRLEFAKKHGYADLVLDAKSKETETVIKSLTENRGADIVMEVAGGTDTFEMAWKLARPSGTVCVIAMYEENQILPLPKMYGKNLTFITGGVDACKCDEILNDIEKGDLNPEPLITHEYPLEKIMEAYELFEKKQDGVIKVAIRP